MISATVRTLVAAALVGSTGAAAGAAVLDTGFGFHSSDLRGYILHNGRQIGVGSAANRARALRRMLPQAFVNPTHPFYVADPAMNAIVLFSKDGTGTQTPSAMLSGASTALAGPIAVSSGYDQPCTANATPSATTCTNYVWVANQLNDTITIYGGTAVGQFPLSSSIQAPTFTYYTSSSCTPQLTAPTGISHVDPVYPNTSGYLVVSDAAAKDLQLYPALGNGVVCPDSAYHDGRFAYPSGVSFEYALPKPEFFNVDVLLSTVIATLYVDNGSGSGTYIPEPGSAGSIWAPGPGAGVVGVTIDSTKPAGGWIWVASDANTPYPFDALWLCYNNQFRHAIANTCPTAAAIFLGLHTPGLPRIAGLNHRIYVPNEGNGTVTAYKQVPGSSPVTTYVNLGVPTGLGIEGQF